MGLKTFLFGKSSSSTATSNGNLKGHAYDSAVALDPPVQGSYPVAGNGPNVLDELQRSRAKKDARRSTGGVSYSRTHLIARSAAAPPNIPRYRSNIGERPQTAPHNGMPAGRQNGASATVNRAAAGRTRSGFAMKSPAPFFASARRDSIRSSPSAASTPSPTSPVPAVNLPHIPQGRDVRTYKPTMATADTDTWTEFQPPSRQHHRSESIMSHRSHVDLFDAHSHIRPSREASRHRAKASGVRNYGEDVADRNIADFGSKPDKAFNEHSPDFSDVRAVYSPQNRYGTPIGDSSHADHVLGQEAAGPSSRDDIQPTQSSTFTSTSAKPHSTRPNVTAPSYAPTVRRAYDDGGRASNGHDRHARALSSSSTETPAVSTDDDVSVLPPSLESPPTPRIPARGRPRPARQSPPPVAAVTSKAAVQVHNPQPVQLTPTPRASSIQVKGYAQPVVAAPSVTVSNRVKSESRQAPPVAFSNEPPEIIHPVQYPHPSLKVRKRTMSLTSQNSYTNGQKPTNGSVSYSPYPNTPSRGSPEGSMDSTPRSPTTGEAKQQGMILEVAKEPLNLNGVVDLSNTVDADVTTKILPALIHEHVTPTRHEIREERITREMHTRDVYHRILPVIETVSLPTKHYIHCSDEKYLIEIPESDIPKYTGRSLESINQGWKLVRTSGSLPNIESLSLDPDQTKHQKPAPSTQDTATLILQACPPTIQNFAEDDGSAASPVVGLTQGEPKTLTRGDPTASNPSHSAKASRTNNFLQPILSSKKTYVTKEGYPKTEYVWRHPALFEDAEGRTQPISPALRELVFPTSVPLNATNNSPIQDDIDAAEHGFSPSEGDAEEDLLFRDSGYGSGMLPGLTEKSPMAGFGLISEPQAKSSPSGTHSGLTEKSPVLSSAPESQSQSNTTPQSNASPSQSDRVLVGDVDETIKFMDEENRPSLSSRSTEGMGEATKYLRCLKERRRSSPSPRVPKGNGSVDKGEDKAVDTGSVEKRNKRVSLSW